MSSSCPQEKAWASFLKETIPQGFTQGWCFPVDVHSECKHGVLSTLLCPAWVALSLKMNPLSWSLADQRCWNQLRLWNKRTLNLVVHRWYVPQVSCSLHMNALWVPLSPWTALGRWTKEPWIKEKGFEKPPVLYLPTETFQRPRRQRAGLLWACSRGSQQLLHWGKPPTVHC